MDCGAYGGEQIFLTTMTAHTLGGNYRLGAVRLVRRRAVYTNTAPERRLPRLQRRLQHLRARAAYRRNLRRHRHGSPCFRRRNVLGDGDLGATGQVFEGDVLGPMLDRMARLREAGRRTSATRADGRLYGRATTVGTWFVFVGPSAATVNLNADGSATLVTSGVEIGSGSMMQSLPQIVADTLGLRPEDVIVRAADTDAAGYDVGVGGGRTTVSLGAASMAACAEVRRKLLEVASEMLEAAPDDLVLANGRVEIVGAKGSGTTIAAVAAARADADGPDLGQRRLHRTGRRRDAWLRDRPFHRSHRYSRLRRPRMRSRGRSRDGSCRSAELRRRAGCRPRAEPARHPRPDPGRRRAGPGIRLCTRKSRSARNGRINQNGLRNLPRAAGARCRAGRDQPVRRRAVDRTARHQGRRRSSDPQRRGGDCLRRVQRHGSSVSRNCR